MTKDNSITNGVKRDSQGRIVKGSKALNPQGRTAGIREKSNQLKISLLNAFDAIGGVQRLERWINDKEANYKEFIKLLFSALPKELDIKSEGVGQDMRIVIVNAPTPIQKESKAPNRVYNNTLKGAEADALGESKASNEDDESGEPR